jgi:choline kinase
MSSVKSVVISCAGIGSRLGLSKTKALINLEGKTLIAYQLEMLKEIEDVRIVVGFQANDVIKEVLKYRKDAIFIFNHNYFETKTGTSFYLGAKHANEYVLEMDGDLLVHPDDMKKLLNIEGEWIAYSDITSDDAVYLNINAAGNVISFSRERGDYEWTGPCCIKKEKIDGSLENVFNQLETNLPMKGIKIRAYDIDTYDDYTRCQTIIRKWQNNLSS